MPSLKSLIGFALGIQRPGRGRPDRQEPSATFAYGKHPKQAVDVFLAGPASEVRPLIVFLHGGAWQMGDKARAAGDMKAPFCRAEGWHFASANFRLVPGVGVTEMAQDVAHALAEIAERADEFGVDRQRIVLMGHSSGAHLAALAATDPRYLDGAGLSRKQLAGVIANDGAAYDARQPSAGAWLSTHLIAPAFPAGSEAELSPAVHARRHPGAPPFLILHTARSRGARQARLLEDALRESGGTVERHAFRGRGAAAHVRLSRRFGIDGFGPTETARRWLRELFG